MKELKTEQTVTAHPLKDEQRQKQTILSKSDSMKVLTPFAFKIDESLFGLSLATPSRRLFALGIDSILVVMLSGVPGELLALFLSITFYRLSKAKLEVSEGQVLKGRKRKKFARWIAALFLFIALANILPSMLNQDVPSSDSVSDETSAPVLIGDDELSVEQAIALTATTGVIIKTISDSDCVTLECWQAQLPDKLALLEDIPFKQEVLIQLYDELSQSTSLTDDEKKQLTRFLVEYHNENLMPEIPTQVDSEQVNSNIATPTPTETTVLNEVADAKSTDAKSEPSAAKPVYSIVKYIEALIQDLGLGFGWAAFYFTVFTSAWHGQTPGKKILKIKVVQLDGTPLSLWDSFGRYGGYGAGIATGLLGFIQIFWDSNRQAIHDKISATVVIDHQRNKNQAIIKKENNQEEQINESNIQQN